MRKVLAATLLLLVVTSGPALTDGEDEPPITIPERTIVLDRYSPVAMLRVGPLETTDAKARRYEGPATLVKADMSEIPLEAVVRLSGNGRCFRYLLTNLDGAQEKVRVRFKARMGGEPLINDSEIGMWFPEPRAFSAGDIDGDGTADLVMPGVAVSGPTEELELFVVRDPGSFHMFSRVPDPLPTGVDPSPPQFLDVNGDGKLDLAVICEDGIRIHLNETAPGSEWPQFGQPTVLPVAHKWGGLAPGDFNGDGRPDLAVVIPSDHRIDVHVNTTDPGAGTATFAAPISRSSDEWGSKLLAGDLNGDGLDDLAVVTLDRRLEVSLSTSSPDSSEASFAVPVRTRQHLDDGTTHLADVNGDGLPDLLWQAFPNMLGVSLNLTEVGAEDVEFTDYAAFDTLFKTDHMDVADMNRDGRPDAVVISTHRNWFRVGVHLNRTPPGAVKARFTGVRKIEEDPDFDVGRFSVADFSGDGWPDVAMSQIGREMKDVLKVHKGAWSISGFKLLMIEPVWQRTRLNGRTADPVFDSTVDRQ